MRHWIAVASADHVRRGRAGGFLQACHGKAAPLARLATGDRIACYSPGPTFGATDRLQAFTALGTVLPGAPYRHDLGGSFAPWRRGVAWVESRPAPIRPLLGALGFTAGRAQWGQAFRFGLLEVSAGDMDLIAVAMGVDPDGTPNGCEAGPAGWLTA